MRNILTLVALVSIAVTGCVGPASLAPSAPMAASASPTAQSQGEMTPTDAPAMPPEPTAAPTVAPQAMPTATLAPQPGASSALTLAKPAVTRPARALPDLGVASEFTGISQWVNSAPLTLASLRGKVVLVDFWTLGCTNCVNTLPYVTGWHEKYKDQGLVVIGVHTPEFAYERDTKNVKAAVAQHRIGYPVAQDNEFVTWNAYRNRYWPAAYFVDARGRIRYIQIGEGGYEIAEQVIQQLLAEAGAVSGG